MEHRAIFVEQCFETLPLADENNEEWYNEACQQRFQGAIEQLLPRRKEIFQLKLSGKYSNDEIAQKLHLSVNTVKFQYSQSLRQIKAIIGDLCCLLLPSIPFRCFLSRCFNPVFLCKCRIRNDG